MNEIDLIILGMISGAVLLYWISKKYGNWTRRKRANKAKKAEKKAIAILNQHGYKVTAQQKRVPIITEIDAKIYNNTVIADFIAIKDGKQYVVEVKTGKQLEKPTQGVIRRQLLEYFLIFRPHGIILLDMEEEKLQHVKFNINYSKLNIITSAFLSKKNIIVFFSGLIIGYFVSRFINL